MRKAYTRWICIVTALALMLCAAGCSQGTEPGTTESVAPVKSVSVDLMADVKAREVPAQTVDLTFKMAQFTYAVNVLRAAAAKKETIMVSPLSLELALAMAANGAKGETLQQLLDLFGASTLEELNASLHSYTTTLGKDCRIADSIWLRSGMIEADPAFLQTNADYYGAEIYEAAFDDQTIEDVNAWVQKNTDGMIDQIMDHIDPLDRMYLLNALCFDAKWQVPYKDDQVLKGVFTAQGGAEQSADMMYSTERIYFCDDHAQGFIKPYEDSRYSFAAIRPNDGIDLFDYLEELTGSHLQMMLSEKQNVKVLAKIPAFKNENEVDMLAVLESLGVTVPFGDDADFTGMCVPGSPEELYISGVTQKTFIEVDREGTRAAAATGLTMAAKSMTQEEVRTVYLDRPFLYLILDGENGLPVFMGVVTQMGGN